MIIAPYNTDAPIYHLPVATGVMIAVNVVIFFFTTLQAMLGNIEFDAISWLCLEFDIINPLQWLTAAFMHRGVVELLGNMVFLWAFGIVVEGKIGSPKFIAIYLLFAVISMAMIQLPMFLLGSTSLEMGSDPVIFGLMMLAVVWAPENEMECFYWLGLVWWGTFEIRLVSLGAIYIALQLVLMLFIGFGVAATGPMAGVLVGTVAAFYLLRRNMVDCEGWDLVSRNEWLRESPLFCSQEQRERIQRVKDEAKADGDPIGTALAMTGSLDDDSLPHQQARASQPVLAATLGIAALARSKTQPAPPTKTEPTAFVDREAERARTHQDFNRLAFLLRQSVDNENAAAAAQAFAQMEKSELAVGLSDKVLFQFVTLLGTRKQWIEAIRPLQIVANRNSANSDDAKLRIAQIQLKVLNNPQQAMRTLATFSPLSESPSPKERQRHEKRNAILAAAQSA